MGGIGLTEGKRIAPARANIGFPRFIRCLSAEFAARASVYPKQRHCTAHTPVSGAPRSGETLTYRQKQGVAPMGDSASRSHSAAEASLGIRQSPRGERLTVPTFAPSGRQERLNCCEKKRR